jgi:diaminohydroxyphosphoribosylaminopyrimidine deaminase/5-amino-6-(5-phosphoribosylamino)uracil reductase
MRLAFEKASEHLGSTKENPSVGCIVVKNGSIVSSGVTSINGRPHAEINALRLNKNSFASTLYTTLEPCVHYGKTSPCINQILKKKISRVCYPILDCDKRTYNKAESILKKNKIKVKIGILKKKAKVFYKSYFLSQKNNDLPFLDAKIAISKDYFSVNKKKKWITNFLSRNKVHLIRSKYDCILSTYKTINKDNSRLNCRIQGLEHLSPSRAIIDKHLKLKKKLNIYNSSKKIKTYVITNENNKKKEKFLKSKNIKIIKIHNKKTFINYKAILIELKKRGFSRILCESGFHTTKELLKNNLIYNLHIFQSSDRLGKNGRNSYRNLLRNVKFKEKNKININLSGNELYNLRIK